MLKLVLKSKVEKNATSTLSCI